MDSNAVMLEAEASPVPLSSVHWASVMEEHQRAENSPGGLRALIPTRELLVKGPARPPEAAPPPSGRQAITVKQG